jgi:hypothetical protein
MHPTVAAKRNCRKTRPPPETDDHLTVLCISAHVLELQDKIDLVLKPVNRLLFRPGFWYPGRPTFREAQKCFPRTIWVLDFHSGTKKPVMPKKKVFAARNLKD